MKNWRFWLHGLLATIINGAASAVVLIIVDPKDFNMQEGLAKLAGTAAVFGVLNAANYLKQHPLPDEADSVTIGHH